LRIISRKFYVIGNCTDVRRKYILKAKKKKKKRERERNFLDFHSGGEGLKSELQAEVVSHAFGVKMKSLLS